MVRRERGWLKMVRRLTSNSTIKQVAFATNLSFFPKAMVRRVRGWLKMDAPLTSNSTINQVAFAMNLSFSEGYG